jgi:hypothetical protein
VTSDELKVALHARPFRPFLLRLRDGGSFPVPTIDHIAHVPGKRAAFIWQKDMKAGELVDLLQVVGVEFLPVQSAGKKRK